ncbi:unnamed protein product [Heterosigma akashiwo]
MMTWMTTGRTRRRRRRKRQRPPMVRRTGLPLIRRPRRPLPKRQRKMRMLLMRKKKPMHRAEGPEGKCDGSPTILLPNEFFEKMPVQ